MRRNIMMPNVWWLLFVLMLVGLVVVPLGIGWRAEAQARVRDVREGPSVGVQSTRVGGFPALKPAVEAVYVQQSLNAMYVLGWNRGTQWDSDWDWTMGREFTFRPWDWDSDVWREDWARTPGERFAHWWVGYCIINCDNYVCDLGEGPCAEVEGELARGFDVALSGVTAR